MTIGEIWRRLSMLLQRDRRTRELEEEMRLHRELRAERLRGQGLSEAQAASGARRRFGNSTLLIERARDIWGGEWLDAAGRELRFAARSLGRSPGFAATAVSALAIGIGASA